MTGKASFAHISLDRVFHEKARLAIVTTLAAQTEGLSFTELKTLCGLTDGNLNRHLQVLEEAGYVSIEKDCDGARPLTRCRLSHLGRQSFCEYLIVLEEVVARAKQAAWSTKSPAPSTG